MKFTSDPVQRSRDESDESAIEWNERHRVGELTEAERRERTEWMRAVYSGLYRETTRS